MVKLLLAAVLLAGAPSRVQARQWWIVSLDGTRCLDAGQALQEEARSGAPLSFATPRQLVSGLNRLGRKPVVSLFSYPTGEESAAVHWVDPVGGRVQRYFFSDQKDCESMVAVDISTGVVPAPPDACKTVPLLALTPYCRGMRPGAR